MTDRVQATVRRWSAEEGGDALRDDGRVIALPVGCLEGSVFRFLRSGQRISIELSGSRVERVDLV